MSKTLLAVDDSKTMRKVLEITFSSGEYEVLLADKSAAALAKLAEKPPAIALVDAQLQGESGYDLCQAIKKQAPGTVVFLMTSRHVPYDKAKGDAVGADDFVDKPFDTQQLLDKVSKAIAAGPKAAGAAAPIATPAPVPTPGHERKTTQIYGGPSAVPPPAAGAAPQPAAASAAGSGSAPSAAPKPLSTTLSGFGNPTPAARPQSAPLNPRPALQQPAAVPLPQNLGRPSAVPGTSPVARPVQPMAQPIARPPAQPAPVAQPPAMTSVQPQTLQTPQKPAAAPVAVAPVAAAPVAAAPVAAAVAVAVDASLTTKLGTLGLDKAQIEGVLALSRELIEQVVWEVVPQLAETMIREELDRLLKD